MSGGFFLHDLPHVAQSEIPTNIMRENIDQNDGTGLVSNPKSEILSPKSKLGRNDPCWCKSGKKWKHCHYPKVG